MKLKVAAVAVCLAGVLVFGAIRVTQGSTDGKGGTAANTEQTTQTEQTESSEEDSTSEEAGSSADEAQQASKDIFAMDTYMTVTAYGEHAQEAVDQAEAEINRLDDLLSTGKPDSEISKLNASGSATLSEDGGYLVEQALKIYKETGGVFDIAIYPIMEAWGFPTKNYQVPDENTLKDLLALTDASQIAYDSESRKISFGKSGMKIDLGGIAKGYTSAKLTQIFKDCGVKSGLINLGGNVQVLGAKPDGSNWRVAVQSPENEQDYLGVLSVKDKAVITSGGYERYFEKDGVTYHHIIDPSTGYPADSGLISVTIVCDDGTLADGLSTSLFIMGEKKAAEFWRAHSDEFDSIMEAEDGTLYVTEGIADSFTSDAKVEVIKK